MSTSRFPEALRAHGLIPRELVGESTYMTSWRADREEVGALKRLWQSLPPATEIPAEPGPCLLRLVPARMSTEGHYGYEYEDGSDRMTSIANRLNAAGRQFPGGIVASNCVRAEGYFIAIRRWFEEPIIDAIRSITVSGGDFSWTEALQKLARQVDECWLAQSDFPFAVRSSNLFVEGGELRLTDQGVALLRKLIFDTYSGPFIEKIRKDEGLMFDYSLPGLPPVHQFASLWTYLRTGLAAQHGGMPGNGVQNGVDRLAHDEKEIVKSTLYSEQPSCQRCEQLMTELCGAFSNAAGSVSDGSDLFNPVSE